MAEPLWGQNSKEKRTRTPELELVLDAKFEYFLFSHIQKINEGNNGIIFRLDFTEVDVDEFKEVKAYFERLGVAASDRPVVKILKIYRPGAGKKEFEMQRRAFNLVEENAAKGDLAQIPEPIFYRELNLTPTGKSFLKDKGMKEDLDQAELLVMDYIPGIDLAVYMYREVVKLHPVLREYRDSVESLDFFVLQALVARALQFKVPSKGATVLADRAFEQDKVFNENEEMLYKYLEQKNFVFPPEITAQFKSTIQLFHRNKFFLRDSHHRNFMITEDPETHKQRGVILDFGMAVQLAETESTAEVYTDGEKKYMHDEAVLAVLQRFSATSKEKEKGAGELRLKDLEKLVGRVEKNQTMKIAWNKFLKDLFDSKENFAGVFEESLKQIKLLRGLVNEEMRVSLWLVFLQEAIKRQKTTKTEVRGLIENYLKSSVNKELIWQNKLAQDIKLFE
jgi:serine/threonine protein kinase